ncbi:hypothetical protein SY83_18845 [Paenibacillus swuensis]|uniref:DUF2953 domain-containing protein n=1 Tax=Paenibacillus swuensis TaxID=1178515 RepID=A0A172TLR2_9BACL|nr:DUF2953 domain-containing protein [Paenibacillus swuensis]ANE48009.1 hypothetical protein SY83_18845 [Paenibacillus swuensis]
MTLLIILSIVALLFVIVLMSSVHIHLRVSRILNDDRIVADARALFGLITYRYEVKNMDFKGFKKGIQVKQEQQNPLKKGKESGGKVDKDLVKKYYDKFKIMLQHITDLFGLGRKILARVRVTEFRWRTTVGLGDAVETAMTTGLVWALKGTLSGFALKYVRLIKRPELSVWPVYNKPHFTSELECRAQVRIGVMMYYGVILLTRITKERKAKQGQPGWEDRVSEA